LSMGVFRTVSTIAMEPGERWPILRKL